MVDTSEAPVGDLKSLTIQERRSRAKRAVRHAKRALQIAEEGRDAALIEHCARQLDAARQKRDCLLQKSRR